MINKLIANIKKTNAPIVVGLDPMLSYVPEQVQKKPSRNTGKPWREPRRPSGSLIKRLWTIQRI